MNNSWNNILRRFKWVVENYPDNIALAEFDDRGVVINTTYSELYSQALKIANYIQVNTANCKDKTPRILLAFKKSSNYIACLMGCLLAKASFTPLDLDLPSPRQEFIKQDVAPHLIIDNALFEKISRNDFDQTFEPDCNIEHNQLAYIIYTSGSTGRPKGVMVSHNGICNIISQQIEMFGLTPNDKTLLLLSISFDASLSDIFCTLLAGAQLYLTQMDKVFVAAKLPQLIQDFGLSYLDIPPSMLSLLDKGAEFLTLKICVIGGEVCDFETVRAWSKKVKLINVYGPTEATICSSMGQCDEGWDKALIGNPVRGVEYRISEDNELLIGGCQLALGYWNNKTLSDQKFIMVEGKRFYKTGDQIIKNENDEYLFKGRLDRQVKIRGQLVELEEVEQTLRRIEGVEQAAVFVKDDALIAVYVAQKTIPNLKDKMAETLPSYMVPAQIQKAQLLLRTATNKVDYKALETSIVLDKGSDALLPQNELEEKFYSLWTQILNKNDFGTDQSFFKVGGDSLKAIEMTFLAEREGLDISPSLLAEKHTIQELASAIQNQSDMSGAMSGERLKSLAELPKDVIEGLKSFKAKQDATNSFFMTGATGFLGARLMADILKDNEDAQFYCLVRAKDTAAAKNRILNALDLHGYDLSEVQAKRIIPIVGDISKPDLGMKDTDWLKVAKKCDQIIHCAAQVNMVKSFDELRAINFDPVFDIMRLGIQMGARRIHNVSTLSVFVSTSSNEGRVLENDNLSGVKTVYGGYAQTKFASELAFHDKTLTHKIPVTSYRLGLITADTKGIAKPANDFLSSFVKGVREIKSLPAGNFEELCVDISPVDFVSNVLAKLIQSPSDNLEDCYHIANEDSFSLAQIVGRLEAKSHKFDILPFKQWEKGLQRYHNNSDVRAASLGLCRLYGSQNFERLRGMDLFQATNIKFDRSRLDALGIEKCPPANDALLDVYLNQIFAHENEG